MTLYVSGETRPPWPSGWSRPVTARRIGFTLLALGLTSFSLIAAVLSNRDGDPRSIFITLMVPAVGAYTIRVIWTRLRGRQHRASAIRSVEVPALQRTALVIRYSGVQSLVYLVIVVALTLLALALSESFLVAGLSEFPRYWFILLPAMAILLLTGRAILMIIHIAGRRLWRGLIALEPEGIYHRAWAYEMYLPWEAVSDIAPLENRGERYVVVFAQRHPRARYRQISSCWDQPEFEFQPSVVLPVQDLPVDPAVLFSLVSYYATHPADRGELSDERAVHRVRQGLFFASAPLLVQSYDDVHSFPGRAGVYWP